MNRVNIIISSKNRLPFLKKCINSIEKNTEIDYNLIIADDNSNFNVIQYLHKTNIKNLKEILCSKQSAGITHSVDSAWIYSRFYNWFHNNQNANYMCYIQDDTVIQEKGWLKLLIEFYNDLHEEHKIGFFGGYDAPEHPTLKEFKHKDKTVKIKKSSRATNLIGTYDHWESCKIPHRIDGDGRPRGFPTANPRRGSNFDIWLTGCQSQGRVMPPPIASHTSNFHQGKTYMCIPTLIKHIAKEAKDSTWNNKNKENS